MKSNTFVSGVIVGSSMLIPGVSGGTMAIILGIYDKLLHSVSHIKSEFKASAVFLLKFCLGAGVGILLLSRVVLTLFEFYEIQMRFFFSGVIVGSVPMLFKRAGVSLKWRKAQLVSCVLPIASGLFICVILSSIPTGLIALEGFSLKSLMILLVAGVVVAVALILPGISVSHILLILGLYELVLKAVGELDIKILLPLFLSVFVSTLIFTSFIERLLNESPKLSYLFITGFVLASLTEVLPHNMPMGITLIVSVILFFMGFLISNIISEK